MSSTSGPTAEQSTSKKQKTSKSPPDSWQTGRRVAREGVTMTKKPPIPWHHVGSSMHQGGEHLGPETVRWRLLAPALDQGLDAFEAFKNGIKSGFEEAMQITFKDARVFARDGTRRPPRLPRVRWSSRYTMEDGLLYLDLDADCAESDISLFELARKSRQFDLPHVGRLSHYTAKGTKIPEDITVITVFGVEAHQLDQFAKHIDAAVSQQLSGEGRAGYIFATDLLEVWNVKRFTRFSSGVEEADTHKIALAVKIYDWAPRSDARPAADTSDASILSHMYAAGSAFRAAHYWPNQLRVDGLPEPFRIEYPGRSCSKASCEQEQEEAAAQARWAQRQAQEREQREFGEALSEALRQARSQAYRSQSPTSGSISASEASSCA